MPYIAILKGHKMAPGLDPGYVISRTKLYSSLHILAYVQLAVFVVVVNRSWSKNFDISRMMYGITIRLAGMNTVSVAQGKQILQRDIRKTRISPER